MATSATRTFNPDFATLMGEAFSRIQIQPKDISTEHIDQSITSANLTFIEFSNRVQHQFQMIEVTLTLAAGTEQYDLPAGALDIWSAVYRKDGTDVPMFPISRTDYHRLPDKDNQGRSFHYFVDRGKVGNTVRTVNVWPVPDNATDTIELWVIHRPLDTTGLPDNIGIAWEWFDAYAANLAWRLARKFKPEMVAELKIEAEMAFMAAKGADRERSPARFRVRGGGMRGRR